MGNIPKSPNRGDGHLVFHKGFMACAQPRSLGPDFNGGGRGHFSFEEHSPETNSVCAPEVVSRFREEWVLEDSNYEFSGVFAVSFYLCKLCYKHIINMRNIWQLDIIQRDLDHGCIEIDLYTFVCCYIMELKSLKSN